VTRFSESGDESRSIEERLGRERPIPGEAFLAELRRALVEPSPTQPRHRSALCAGAACLLLGLVTLGVLGLGPLAA
jgi:hypothetical protein